MGTTCRRNDIHYTHTNTHTLHYTHTYKHTTINLKTARNRFV